MVVAVFHLLPALGVLGHQKLLLIYGISFTDANALILMRDRAVLFGLLGVFMLAAAFVPKYQTAAFAAGLLSVGSFMWLAWSSGGTNPQIGNVFAVDVVVLLCLVLGVAAYVWQVTLGTDRSG